MEKFLYAKNCSMTKNTLTVCGFQTSKPFIYSGMFPTSYYSFCSDNDIKIYLLENEEEIILAELGMIL